MKQPLAVGALGLLLALGSTAAMAQEVVRVVVGFPPGSAVDNIARLVAERMSEVSKTRYLVDNVPGASGNMGAATVAKARGDGSTILLTGDNPVTTNKFLFDDMGFDPLVDLKPISIAATNTIAMVVHPSLPVNTVEELIDYAKENPGKVFYASSGVGSPHHLAGELLKTRTGIDINHVPYKGGGPALADLAGGHVSMAFSSVSGALPLAKGERIRMLGVTDLERYDRLPDLPAIAETVPDFLMASWIGFFAPGTTPDDVVARINATIVEALQDEKLREQLLDMGLVPVANTPEEATEMVVADSEVRGELVRISGATLD